ncbi:MAG: oligosaccharide flippase family protein [Paracoccaceae bacterium]|nr:oligosaccharide flippase family protein [Paracoccaceae bacterium]
MTTQGPVRRAIRNAGWLMAGKGTGGVFSLVYIALAARSLGVEQFGVFALILSYGQAVSNLAQFQSWQSVVRYGAVHHLENQPARLRRILNFSTLLDLGAASVGALLGVIGALVIGPYLGWSDQEQLLALFFSLSVMFGLRGTPTGILRLFDRFDLAAYSETVLPTMRLLGALIAWAMGASIIGYLIVWAAAELISTVAMWWAALREVHRQDLRVGEGSRLRGVVAENPGLWRFAWSTNFNTSVSLIWKQLPVLVVGWAVNAVAAGGFRIAANLVGALNKPAVMLARAMYPELAKLAVTERGRVARVVRKVTVVAAGVGVLAVILMAVFGKLALHLIGGEAYIFAYPFLLVLSVAAAIELCGVAVEPAMIALGRPGTVLLARSVTGIFYAGVLIWLANAWGAIGAATAAIVGAIFMLIMLFGLFMRAIR